MLTNSKPADLKGTVVYFSHGGGPLPILGDRSHVKMVEFMQRLPARFSKPDAIIVVSAHWEETIPTVLGASNPEMFYDYYGFPDAAYDITYPVSGSPDLASRVVSLLRENQVASRIDKERGFDHGLYIPLRLMYPDADVPSIQLSLVRGLDPATHINLGKALRELMKENILVIGSGFSFHNMRAFIWDGTEPGDAANNVFQNWLIETCTKSIDQSEREERLVQWEKATSARYCHPREEHLLPLHVCVGIAGDDVVATKVFDNYILGKRAVAFQW